MEIIHEQYKERIARWKQARSASVAIVAKGALRRREARGRRAGYAKNSLTVLATSKTAAASSAAIGLTVTNMKNANVAQPAKTRS
mgnify:CR=1 FL=1